MTSRSPVTGAGLARPKDPFAIVRTKKYVVLAAAGSDRYRGIHAIRTDAGSAAVSRSDWCPSSSPRAAVTQARLCEREGRWSFLCAIAPLRLPTGTGSPVNPIAIL